MFLPALLLFRVMVLPNLLMNSASAECTTIIVGREASVDGSVIATHSNDCSDCDFRMAYVPARNHSAGAQRPVFGFAEGGYPKIVSRRAKIYEPRDPSQKLTVPLGYIPEVAETYALYESGYGLINEHGLGIGESTGAAVLDGRSIAEGGNALFCTTELIAVALERCRSVECAIRTMGGLAETYGFFGEEQWTGEALTVVDNEGESWLFHVTAALNGTSAVWVAQRIPPSHVAVVSNSLIIGDVDPASPDFMLSKNLYDVARREGLWDGALPLHFSRTFAYDPPWRSVKTVSPLYATMRRWRVFDRIAPSQGFLLSESSFSYPVSIAPDHKLALEDVLNLHRDHFEGSAYDMRKGILAGPYGNPNRQETDGSAYFTGVAGQKGGQVGRPISMPRSSYNQAVQTHVSQPKVWFAMDTASSSVFVPFFARALAEGRTEMRGVDDSYATGNQLEFRFGEGAWWAFDFVANWMNLNFENMSQRYVYPMVRETQQDIIKKTLEAEAARHGGHELEQFQLNIQRNITRKWWDFASTLVVRYNDGFLNFEPGKKRVEFIPYPEWYLDKISFDCERGLFAAWPKIEPSSLGLLETLEGLTPEIYNSHPARAQWNQCPPPYLSALSSGGISVRAASLRSELPAGVTSTVVPTGLSFGFAALLVSAFCGAGLGALVTIAVLRQQPLGCDSAKSQGYRHLG